MFGIKERIYDKRADFILYLLLESFYLDYNNKRDKNLNTLWCYGSLIIEKNRANEEILKRVAIKADKIGAEISCDLCENSVYLTFREKGIGQKHTLKQ